MFSGMTDSELRDYFAGEALKGLLSNSSVLKALTIQNKDKTVEQIRELIVDIAYDYSNIMLNKRNKIY